MNRKAALVLILSLCSFSVFAGDVADYVNLGFSDNSEYFMFGLYGISRDGADPYAELYTVDVRTNNFAENGVFTRTYDTRIQNGQDGNGALYNLLDENHLALSRFNINHLNKGRIIYILATGEHPEDNLDFRDFKGDGSFKVSLKQTQLGAPESPKASFYIDLTYTDRVSGVSTYRIGRPDYVRDGVFKYLIKEVMLSPDEKSVLFIVQKEMIDGSGPSIRYMVETVNLK